MRVPHYDNAHVPAHTFRIATTATFAQTPVAPRRSLTKKRVSSDQRSLK